MEFLRKEPINAQYTIVKYSCTQLGFYLVTTAELTEGQVILLGWERKKYGSEYQVGTQGGLVNSQSD